MNTYAVIVAGGSGSRMGTAVPKQFLELAGRPVLYHTLKAFIVAIPEVQLILVLPAHQLSYAQMVLQAFPERIDVSLVAGGETRFHSVQAGLGQVPEDDEQAVVLVHDGVRALVSPALIRRCRDAARDHGTAIPAIPVADSIRILTASGSEAAERSALRSVQTPQAFGASALKRAFAQPYDESFTDEATVWEAATSGSVHLVEGEKQNLKITTPEDLIIAEAFLKSRKEDADR